MIPIRKGKQLDQLRVAAKVASSILRQISRAIQPGVTTGEIDAMAVELMRENDCRSAFLGYRNFPGNICISVNEEVVHGIGGPRPIQYGDIVKVDVGIIKDGWVGDNAMTVPVGAVSPQVNRLLYATEEALHTAISFARPGVRLGELCGSVEKTAIRYGFTVVREFVGHGVGRKLHEEPQVPNYGKPNKGPRLRAGMVLAIEPMVNMGRAGVEVLADNWTVVTLDRKPSAHYEHMALVTDDGPEILTERERVAAVPAG